MIAIHIEQVILFFMRTICGHLPFNIFFVCIPCSFRVDIRRLGCHCIEIILNWMIATTYANENTMDRFVTRLLLFVPIPSTMKKKIDLILRVLAMKWPFSHYFWTKAHSKGPNMQFIPTFGEKWPKLRKKNIQIDIFCSSLEFSSFLIRIFVPIYKSQCECPNNLPANKILSFAFIRNSRGHEKMEANIYISRSSVASGSKCA